MYKLTAGGSRVIRTEAQLIKALPRDLAMDTDKGRQAYDSGMFDISQTDTEKYGANKPPTGRNKGGEKNPNSLAEKQRDKAVIAAMTRKALSRYSHEDWDKPVITRKIFETYGADGKGRWRVVKVSPLSIFGNRNTLAAKLDPRWRYGKGEFSQIRDAEGNLNPGPAAMILRFRERLRKDRTLLDLEATMSHAKKVFGDVAQLDPAFTEMLGTEYQGQKNRLVSGIGSRDSVGGVTAGHNVGGQEAFEPGQDTRMEFEGDPKYVSKRNQDLYRLEDVEIAEAQAQAEEDESFIKQRQQKTDSGIEKKSTDYIPTDIDFNTPYQRRDPNTRFDKGAEEDITGDEFIGPPEGLASPSRNPAAASAILLEILEGQSIRERATLMNGLNSESLNTSDLSGSKQASFASYSPTGGLVLGWQEKDRTP